MDMFKKNKGDWSVYEKQFLDLLTRRHVEDIISKDTLDGGCLLCSEDKPDHCHRRLVAEYLNEKWGNIDIIHIVWRPGKSPGLEDPALVHPRGVWISYWRKNLFNRTIPLRWRKSMWRCVTRTTKRFATISHCSGYHSLIKGLRWVAISMSHQKSTGVMDDIWSNLYRSVFFEFFKNSVVVALSDLWIH